jgi:hypothetical protein
MGVPSSEVGYNSATTGKGDHEVQKGHVVALGKTFASLKKKPLKIFEVISLIKQYKTLGIQYSLPSSIG